MDDAWQILSEHLTQLTLNLLLKILLDHSYTVKGTAHVDALKGVIFENERDALLLGDDKYDDGLQPHLRKAQLHRHDKGPCCK